MKVLQFIPPSNIDSFNTMLSGVCEKHDIIGVTAAVVHNTLLLTLTEATDLPVAVSPVLLQPIVVPFDGEMLPSLAQALSTFIDQVVKTSTEEAPRDPAEVRILARTDDPKAGYVVILLCVGLIEGDEA